MWTNEILMDDGNRLLIPIEGGCANINDVCVLKNERTVDEWRKVLLVYYYLLMNKMTKRRNPYRLIERESSETQTNPMVW